MKFALLTVLGVLTSNCLATTTHVNLVYGTDDRQDVRDVEDERLKEMARSTGAFISNRTLNVYNDPTTSPYIFNFLTLGGKLRICPGERFLSQPAISTCSGFLIDEKTMVTAGHCVNEFTGCSDRVWVFDYRLDDPNMETMLINPAQIYSCAKVIKTINDDKRNLDYALVELDRPVTDRAPLKFRRTGKVKTKTPLVVIGHPSGLPTKVAGGARVMSQAKNYFGANLDTFGGNSGSAVINALTYEVEGVLVRGDDDYNLTAQDCKVVNVRSRDRDSEKVTRITKIVEAQALP